MGNRMPHAIAPVCLLLLLVAGCQASGPPGRGELKPTDRMLDLAIDGEGFFVVAGDEETLYTRAGRLFAESTGELVVDLENGYTLRPTIVIPPGAAEVTVTPEGVVSVVVAGQPTRQPLGRITLAVFANPAGLRRVRGQLYRATGASGAADVRPAGDGVRGRLRQGYLETWP